MTPHEARSHNLRVMAENRDEIPISELLVDRDCRICYRGRDKIVPEGEIMLLSPAGVVHHGNDYGMTECGHDATGNGWWWRL